jgi:hypothetical protein
MENTEPVTDQLPEQFEMIATLVDPQSWQTEYAKIRKDNIILKEWHTMSMKRERNPSYGKAGLIIPGIDPNQEYVEVPVISSVIFVQKKQFKESLLITD